MSDTQLRPANKTVGGWLIVLILWFAFWIPAGVQGDIATIQKFFAAVIDQFPSMQSMSTICSLLLWTAAIVSIYCAYVLAFKKIGALVVAKRGLIFIVVIQLSLNTIILVLAHPPLHDIPFAILVKPLIWLAIWYTYLVRSKRVKETYVV